MKRFRLIGLLALFFAVAAVTGIVAAQVPGLFIASPTGEEQINVLNSGPQIATVRLTQIRDASSYQIIQQASTNVITQTNDVGIIAFFGATSGAVTITTESSPVDGQRLQVFSQAGASTLTMVGATGQTFNNAPTSLGALGSVEFIYQASNATWYRTS